MVVIAWSLAKQKRLKKLSIENDIKDIDKKATVDNYFSGGFCVLAW